MSSVHTGQHVTSPPVPQPRPQARPATESYTVKSGDSLWNIAKEKYGDGMKWKDIYADNKDVIGGNPDLIHPGMNLQLRGLQSAAPAATTTPAEAPQETAPEPVSEATPDPVEQNQVADVPGGRAATTVDLFDEEETPVATPQAHPELVEEPAAEDTPVAPVTELVAEPAAEPATEAPAAQAAAEQMPDVQAAETPTAPVNEPVVAPAAEGTEAPAEGPIEEPSAMTFPPAAPTPDAAESDAPPVIATSEAPTVDTESPAPLATPAAESAPEADTAPASPELAQATALLSTIDGKGYTVAHHGDPVGGIPQVARAMDEVLAMSASGAIDKLPEGATRDKMNQWAQDIVQGRLAQAGRQFDGVTESRTAKVNDLLSHPAFEQLPTEQQDRLYQGLRSGYEMMGYLPADRLSDTGKALQSRLAEHFGDTAPAAAETAPAAEAPEGIAAEPVVSEAAPVVETAAPVMPAPATSPVAEPPVAVQAESPEAPVMQAESPAPLATPAAESLPEVDTAPANPELDQAVALLSTIDGKGYTVAHHGDPVGGIPKVARAMDEVLAMSASGAIDKLPEGATRDKMNQWAQDIVQGRLAQAGRQFDGVTESRTAQVNDLLSHPAFEQLPTEQQDRLYQGLRSGYEMMGYLPADRLSDTGKALQSRLAEHFGDTAPAAEAPAPQAPETAAPQATISTDDLRVTLQEDVGFFGKGDHQKKLLTQSQSLVAATPAARQEVSQLLSDHQQYEVLSGLLAEASSAQMAEVLTHPDIRGLRVIEASEDAVAGQFLTALAEHKTTHVGAEDLIARTVEAFDGTFNDREDPFEILMKQQAFENLSEALQAQIRDLVKGW